MSRIILGAPSLNEKGANELVREAFGSLNFPLSLRFTNLTGHAQHYPSIALYVSASGSNQDTVVQEVQNFDTLISFSTDVAGLAGMYQEEKYLEITDDIALVIPDEATNDVKAEVVTSDAPAKTKKVKPSVVQDEAVNQDPAIADSVTDTDTAAVAE